MVFACTERFLVGGSLHGVSRSITELSSKLRFLCVEILLEQKTIDRILPEIDQIVRCPNVISTTDIGLGIKFTLHNVLYMQL